VSKACGVPGKMPTYQQLSANGYSTLATATSKHHGGMHKFAERLDLPMQHNQALPNHFQEFQTLEAAVLEFAAVHEIATKTMPTVAQLGFHGRSDLANAMPRHGGLKAVAGRLGLEMSQDHLPNHYWKDAEVMREELLQWIEQHGTPGTMPTKAQLITSGRADIVNGISTYHRGFKAVAAALGLRPGSNPPSVKPLAYWQQWENAEAEMPAVSKACGVPGKMPTLDQLRVNGYSSLEVAIVECHGGMHKFAERLNRVHHD
jgi:hypothetical protein